MKLAAVDIGSNAIRMQISSVITYHDQSVIKKYEYIRFPLRLGKSVFETGAISEAYAEKFLKLMQAFGMLMDLYAVEDYMICATSAMREAANGPEIVDQVLQKTGLTINVINGQQEADLINQSIVSIIDEATYLHIDVGGGSTELTLYANRVKIASTSFRVGSVRDMANINDPGIWKQIDEWLKANIKRDYFPVTAIGTGGNINKIYELSRTKNKKARSLTLTEAATVLAELNSLTLEERIYQLMLNPDRADVIIPAAEIYLHVMRSAKARKIIVPDSGLKDGIIDLLYQKNKHKLGM